MNADKAFENIVGLLSDYQSFSEGFDHEFHGDSDPTSESYEGDTDDHEFNEDTDCRFEQYDIDESLKVIKQVIVAAKHVVSHFEGGSITDEDLASLDILGTAMAMHTHNVVLTSSESDGENRFYLTCECGWETDYFVHPTTEARTGRRLIDGSWEPAPGADWNDANA